MQEEEEGGADALVALDGALEPGRDLERRRHELAAGRAVLCDALADHVEETGVADDVLAGADDDWRVGGAEANRAVEVVGERSGEEVEVWAGHDLQGM